MNCVGKKKSKENFSPLRDHEKLSFLRLNES
jgi:hypothetical protein